MRLFKLLATMALLGKTTVFSEKSNAIVVTPFIDSSELTCSIFELNNSFVEQNICPMYDEPSRLIPFTYPPFRRLMISCVFLITLSRAGLDLAAGSIPQQQAMVSVLSGAFVTTTILSIYTLTLNIKDQSQVKEVAHAAVLTGVTVAKLTLFTLIKFNLPRERERLDLREVVFNTLFLRR